MGARALMPGHLSAATPQTVSRSPCVAKRHPCTWLDGTSASTSLSASSAPGSSEALALRLPADRIALAMPHQFPFCQLQAFTSLSCSCLQENCGVHPAAICCSLHPRCRQGAGCTAAVCCLLSSRLHGQHAAYMSHTPTKPGQHKSLTRKPQVHRRLPPAGPCVSKLMFSCRILPARLSGSGSCFSSGLASLVPIHQASGKTICRQETPL